MRRRESQASAHEFTAEGLAVDSKLAGGRSRHRQEVPKGRTQTTLRWSPGLPFFGCLVPPEFRPGPIFSRHTPLEHFPVTKLCDFVADSEVGSALACTRRSGAHFNWLKGASTNPILKSSLAEATFVNQKAAVPTNTSRRNFLSAPGSHAATPNYLVPSLPCTEQVCLEPWTLRTRAPPS